METKTQMNPKLVCRVMRQIKREQCTDFSPKDIARYIIDNRLMRVVQWPAFCIVFTDKGLDYLSDNTEVEE